MARHKTKRTLSTGTRESTKSERIYARYLKGERTLEKIRQAAIYELSEKGYHQTSVCDIVKRANLTRGAFYNYWNSLEECILDVLNYSLESDRFSEEIEKWRNSTKHPSETVRTVQVVSTLIGLRNWHVAFLTYALAQDKNLPGKKLKKRVAERMIQEIEFWNRVIQQDQNQGIIKSHLDSQAAGTGIALLMGLFLHQFKNRKSSSVGSAEESALIFLLESLFSEEMNRKNPIKSVILQLPG